MSDDVMQAQALFEQMEKSKNDCKSFILSLLKKHDRKYLSLVDDDAPSIYGVISDEERGYVLALITGIWEDDNDLLFAIDYSDDIEESKCDDDCYVCEYSLLVKCIAHIIERD